MPYPAATGATAPTYTVQFDVTGGVTTYSVLEDGNPLVSGEPYVSGNGIPIPGRGMTVNVAGSPATGDSFTLTQSNNTLSVFDTLDKAIAALNSSSLNNGQIQQNVNSTLTSLDGLLSNMGAARSAVGESLNRMDSIEERIAELKLNAQTDRSNAEDLDMVQAISSFQNKQTGYDAALKSYSMVQKLSLFNYVNP